MIHIPASIEDAVSKLNGLERLLTATEWEKAAIVAAFVTLDGTPGPKSSASSSRSLTAPEFAALGITGLKSKDTVRRYVAAWESTGLPKPTPGSDVELPTVPFPEAPKKPAEDKSVKEIIAEVDASDPVAVQEIAAASSAKLHEAADANRLPDADERSARESEVEVVLDQVLDELDAAVSSLGPNDVLEAVREAHRLLASVLPGLEGVDAGLLRSSLVSELNSIARLINHYGPRVAGSNDWDLALVGLLEGGNGSA